MANPFYSNHWNPIRHGYYPQAQIQPYSAKPKVINIPVHFVGSDEATSKQSPVPVPAPASNAAASAVPTRKARIAAAVTIQRAVRGFLVRKNVCLVRQVAAEVEEIERKLKEEEAKIRLNARERLLLSETLMALLLRLDSVRGVRDFRKRVIRKVISLQEAIDSISAAADASISTIYKAENSRDEVTEDSSIYHEKTTDQTSNLDEEMNKGEIELRVEIPAAVESSKRKIDQIAAVNWTVSTSGAAEDREVLKIKVGEEASKDQEKGADKTLDHEEETDEGNAELEMEVSAVVESSERQSDLTAAAADGAISSRSVTEDREGSADVAEESLIDHEMVEDQSLDLEEESNEAEAESKVELRAAVESPKRKSNLIGIEIGEDGSRSPELEEEILKAEEGASMMVDSTKREEESRMWAMMALENEKLKGMVAQLCATSSEQYRLMKGLVDRVEQLERAVHHRMNRRKKRRSSAACSAFSSAK